MNLKKIKTVVFAHFECELTECLFFWFLPIFLFVTINVCV